MSRTISFFLFFVLWITSPLNACAAGLDLVKVITTPATPGPNKDVHVTLQSFAVDLDTAEIIWYVDKEPVAQGVAKKSIDLHTGDLGDKTVVDILIVPIYGERLNKQITIEPSEIDLLWEADTYTPPFYRGKALPTFKSMVKMTTIPRRNSYTSNPSVFYYKWTYNRIEGLGEALGMNSVLLRSGWPNSSVPVKVDVSQVNSEWKGSETVNIPGHTPKVVFYEEQPLLGTLFNRALSGTQNGAGNSLSLRAVPYFFSTDNLEKQELVYTWTINGARIATPLEPTNLELNKSGKGSESFNVSLRIQNPKRILQEARGATNITLPKEE